MNVNEVVELAVWLEEYIEPTLVNYEALASAMQQNANNGSKVLLRDYLDALEIELKSLPIERLTLEQTDLLTELDCLDLIGSKGWKFVERTVKEGNFDPASAAADIVSANAKIKSAFEKMTKAKFALENIGIQGHSVHSDVNSVVVRIRFQGDVNIANVAQLKNRTADWYDISRGLAMATGEKPEDIEVQGATNGSIIVVLGTSLAIASLIALIMKQVASTVKSSAEIAHTLQDWKMRKIADEEVERVLKGRKKKVEESGNEEALIAAIKAIGKSISGDAENALRKSIEKMFSFSAKGGEVDMLPPPLPDEEDEVDATTTEAIKGIRGVVEKMRNIQLDTQKLIEAEKHEQDGD